MKKLPGKQHQNLFRSEAVDFNIRLGPRHTRSAFLNPNYSTTTTRFLKKKNFHDPQLRTFIICRPSSSKLVLPYFQQKISIIVMPTTSLKSSTTHRLRNAALNQCFSIFFGSRHPVRLKKIWRHP
jgi:hypothetical protein